MNIQHLRYAVEVEKTGSISQAAENLYMGQPNLSKAIKELEASLGISIFRRTSKGVVTTVKGEEFLLYAKNILSQIDEIESLYKPGNSNKQELRISTPRGTYITHAFTRFVASLKENKAIELYFRETNPMRTIRNVVEEGYHLGIIRYQSIYETYFMNFLKEKGLSHKEIWEFEHLALMSCHHPLAKKKLVTYEELMDYTEILHGDLSIPYLSLPKLKEAEPVEQIKKRIYVYERGSQFDLLRRVHSTYMWVSPIPEEVLQQDGLVQRKCNASDHTYKDVLIFPKGHKNSELEQQFLEFLYAVRDEVKSKHYK